MKNIYLCKFYCKLSPENHCKYQFAWYLGHSRVKAGAIHWQNRRHCLPKHNHLHNVCWLIIVNHGCTRSEHGLSLRASCSKKKICPQWSKVWRRLKRALMVWCSARCANCKERITAVQLLCTRTQFTLSKADKTRNPKFFLLCFIPHQAWYSVILLTYFISTVYKWMPSD